MTARRAYQPRRTPEGAIAELRSEAGRQFNPRLVAALEALWERGALDIEEGPEFELGVPAAAGGLEGGGHR